MTQPLDLDAIEARAQVATDGPWERYEKYGPDFFACTTGSHLRGVGTFNFGDGTDADADEEFVKHAVQDVRALVAEVHRLRALVAQCDHRACPGFPDDCPNPVMVNPDPPAHFGGVRCGCRPAEPRMVCITCETPVGWINCPTGGWWAHETHPEDNHDAAPRPAGETIDARTRTRTLTESEHNRAWHAIEGAAGEEGADPGTVLNAVLSALGINPPAEEVHVVADDSDDPEHIDDCPGCQPAA